MAFDKAKALGEAERLIAQGKVGQAIKRYWDIYERAPSDLGLLNTIGDLYVRFGEVAEGRKLFQRLAEAYVREGSTAKGIAIYKKIAKLDPDSVAPLLKLIELYQAQMLAGEARELYYRVAECYRRQKQDDKALEALRRAVQLDVEQGTARVHLAAFCERIGRPKEAAQVYLESARLALRRGDRSAAQSALERAERLDPDNPEIPSLRAGEETAETSGREGGEAQRAAGVQEKSAGEEESSLPREPSGAPALPGAREDGAELPAHRGSRASAIDPSARTSEIEEIDLSEDWESFLAQTPTPLPAAEVLREQTWFNDEDSCAEVLFYLQQGLIEEARNAVAELESAVPGDARIAELRALVEEQEDVPPGGERGRRPAPKPPRS